MEFIISIQPGHNGVHHGFAPIVENHIHDRNRHLPGSDPEVYEVNTSRAKLKHRNF